MHYIAFGLCFSDCSLLGVMLQLVISTDFRATFLVPPLMVISFGVLCTHTHKSKRKKERKAGTGYERKQPQQKKSEIQNAHEAERLHEQMNVSVY